MVYLQVDSNSLSASNTFTSHVNVIIRLRILYLSYDDIILTTCHRWPDSVFDKRAEQKMTKARCCLLGNLTNIQIIGSHEGRSRNVGTWAVKVDAGRCTRLRHLKESGLDE